MNKVNNLVLCAALALGVASPSFAQASFSFSWVGESGTGSSTLRATLLAPLDFTVTRGDNSAGCYFLFEDVGSPMSYGDPLSSSTISFSVNDGPAYPIDFGDNNGTFGGTADVTDVVLSNMSFSETLHLGDIVHLFAGEVVFGAPASFVPNAGVFTATILDGVGSALGTGSVISVPEPGTSAGLAGLAVLGLVALRRRR